jgi:alpha-D-ribose 1-methylphosphonate 5-triphosphate synthase subunit PhnL
MLIIRPHRVIILLYVYRIFVVQKRLYEIDVVISKILSREMTLKEAVDNHKPLIRKEMYFRLAELANAALDPVEKQRFALLFLIMVVVVTRDICRWVIAHITLLHPSWIQICRTYSIIRNDN